MEADAGESRFQNSSGLQNEYASSCDNLSRSSFKIKRKKKVPGDTAKQQSAHLQGLREESKIEYSPW